MTTYKIIYDVDRDIWNWYYGSKCLGVGERLTEADDISIFQKIEGLNRKEFEKMLRPYLKTKLEDRKSALNDFIRIARQEFSEKFVAACDVLAKITGRPMVDGDFIFYVTTFPRMVVFFDEKIIFMYAKIDDVLWGMPIDGFLHEGLHFQFDKYYRQDGGSGVAKLTDEEYFVLKESLTVILDRELKPIITVPDNSYPEFSGFRELLHGEWRKDHDFDRLVEFGVRVLPKFVGG
jgi:hypothetical protein